MEANSVFREKSLNKIKSPDNLNQYIKVANPGMWLGLFAVLLILVGVIVWGCVARFDTVSSSCVVVKDSTALCYFLENNVKDIQSDSQITIEGQSYVLGSRSSQTIMLSVDNEEEAYLLHKIGLEESGWFAVFEITGVNLEDGIYVGECVVDSVRPISFFFNSEM